MCDYYCPVGFHVEKVVKKVVNRWCRARKRNKLRGFRATFSIVGKSNTENSENSDLVDCKTIFGSSGNS